MFAAVWMIFGYLCSTKNIVAHTDIYIVMTFRKIFFVAAAAICCAASATAGQASRTEGGLAFQAQGLNVRVEFYSPDIVRVYKEPVSRPCKKVSIPVIMKPGRVELSFGGGGGVATVASERVAVSVDTETGGIVFADKQGNIMLRDKDYGTQFTPRDDAGRPSFEVRQAFLLDSAEVIYGLGQQQTGLVSQRNQRLLLRNQNMSICIPFVHSAKGYGLYWDNYSPTTFTDNPQEMSFDSEVGDCADYYFIYGGTADGVIAGVRALTGQAPMYPLWTLGFWQSRERYKTQDEVLSTLAEFRRRRIPIDNIVQDWNYWEDDQWGSHRFDPKRYPDPQLMLDSVHAMHGRFMISVWPKFYCNTDNYRQLDSNGWIYRRAVADSIRDWVGPGYVGSFYDAYSAGARRLFWKQMDDNLYSRYTKGIDAWWMDASEPNVRDCTPIGYRKALCGPTALGTSDEYFNAYSIVNADAIYNGQRSAAPDRRVFLLTRSGFAGLQRYSTATWSGDIGTRWEDMRAQMTAGINFSMSGIPFWGMDQGGFCVEKRYVDAQKLFDKTGTENADLAEWRELQARWNQFGCFIPLYRAHGQWPLREAWNIAPEGHPAYESITFYHRLRYRLMPYLYSMAGWVWLKDYTMMRGLAMDFADDPAVRNIADQWMFGPAFMACPVSRYKARSREVYLPRQCGWYDLYTGRHTAGGQKLTADAPYGRIPVFVREGAIVPFGPAIQWSDERQADTICLYVYAGADGEFMLYEDEGTNYNYEKGLYSTIRIAYDDSSRRLTIGPRQGSFDGMPCRRSFRIVYVTAGKPVPMNPDSREGRMAEYSGSEVTIDL